MRVGGTKAGGPSSEKTPASSTPASSTAAEEAVGGRWRGLRWAGAGLADQVLIALANAGTTLLTAALLPLDRAAGPLLAIAVAYFVIGINRAFVGEVFTALASRYDGEHRDRLVREGLAASTVLGLISALAFVAIWALWPHRVVDLQNLIWLAPFIPGVLVQDAGRYSHLADRRPDRALTIDAAWVLTQVTVVVSSLLLVGPSGTWLLVAWGLGATVSVTVFLVRTRPAIWRGNPRRWIAQTRQLSGWFTATALVAQVQTLAVNVLVAGRLSPAALTGLRAAQTALLQPVQNFQLAVQGLLVPRLSRLAAEEAFGELAARVRRIMMAFAGLAVVVVSVLWPTATLVLTHIPKFAVISPLALPISLQAGIYLVQVPITAALRATHQARIVFGQYATFTTVSLTGLVVGAQRGGLPGAAWGLCTGSTVGFLVAIGCFWYVMRRLGAPHRVATRRLATGRLATGRVGDPSGQRSGTSPPSGKPRRRRKARRKRKARRTHRS